jgi:hypothetical protein
MRRGLALGVVLLAMAGARVHAQAGPDSGNAGHFVALDHVVAVVNGEVLLQSDVDAEMRFAALEPALIPSGTTVKDTPQSALNRLISRVLIVQQMKELQQYNANIPEVEVEKSLEDARAHLPECAKYDCTTPKGWTAFLAANDLTEQEVLEHWKQRMAILKFIDARFRTGIRISQASIADYYTKTVVPAFERKHQAAPPLKSLSARIQEVLLQQQVNAQLQDWLKSLRAEGTLRILDTAYGQATDTPSDTGTTGEGASE